MAGVFQKVRLIALSNIHTLLDRVIDLNSVGAVEQYIRDLEGARDSLDNEAAGFKSDVNNLPKTIAVMKAQAHQADVSINTLMTDGDDSNNHLIPSLETQMIGLEKRIKLAEEQLESSKKEYARFTDATQKLDMKLIAMSGQLETLRALASAASTKERAAKALSGISLGDTPNVDNVEARLRKRADVADHKLDRELGRMTGAAGGPSALDAEVAARIARRKQALAEKAQAPAASGESK